MKSKPVQRVLHVFLEMLPKRDPSNGQFISDLIMICEIISQQIRVLLYILFVNWFFTSIIFCKGPNEYLAGCTLRFISSIREENLIQPLLPSILDAITHEHLYVRTNALNCMLQITQTFPSLFNDELEKKIYDVLDNDESVECQVMAFKLIAMHEPVVFSL